MALKIYSYPANARVMKALIAAEYNGVEIELPEFEMGVTNKEAWFLELNPAGKVPTMATPEGGIFESNAIARYVARLRADTGLMGSTFFESGRVDSWVDFITNEVETPLLTWLLMLRGILPPNPKAVGKLKQDAKRALTTLEQHLTSRTFIVGESVTLADIVGVCALLYPLKFLLNAEFRKPFPSVVRWFRTCVNQPQFRAIVGEVALCVEEPDVTAASKKAKKEKKGKKEKKAQPKKEKKEKKEEAKAEEKPKKKGAHPLTLLPRSSFVMDDWKRHYSNAGQTDGDYYKGMDHFWEVFDSEGYSLWIANYNYNAENKVGFMTSNLVGGFMQRCDAVRKYLFGVMSILKNEEAGCFDIVGCFLFRGDDITHLLEANPDAEYYTFTKIDAPLSDEDKKKVADIWCAGEELMGMPIEDSKVFK